MEINNHKEEKTIENIFIKDEYQTIMVCDGITYSNNAGSIVRQCSIFGCSNIIFCPLDIKRFDKINSNLNNRPINNDHPSNNEDNAFHTYQLKNIHIDPIKGIRYNKSFKKSVKKFSINHQEYTNVYYDINIKDIVEEGLKNKFIIFRLENCNKTNNIFYTDLSYKKIMFIVGNECEGISDYVMQNSNIKDLYIPSMIQLDSLNVANVSTVTCFERFRQINLKKI